MCLLHTARIGHSSLAHVWVANIVVRAIGPTILVFRADVPSRWVRKVVIDFESDASSVEAHTNGWRGRTHLNKFTFKLGHLVLQTPIRMFREEVDDVLELYDTNGISDVPPRDRD